MTNIVIFVKGADELEKTLEKLAKAIQTDVMSGMKQYVSQHLVNRIKTRIENGTQGQSSSPGQKGLIPPSGGYGFPYNDPNYAQWKKTRKNLPMVGSVKTRELVATGYFLDKIKMTRVVQTIDFFEAEVGPEDGNRPTTKPMRDETGNTVNAKTSFSIDNKKLAQLLEDGDYKFWVKEYDDVQKEVGPFLEYLIETTIKDLMLEYTKA